MIDVPSLSFVQNIYRIGQSPHGIAVDVANQRVYVSSENTGGLDSLHHPLEGNVLPPGKYNVIDIKTLTVDREMETEVAEFPNAVVVSGN
ncbi:MAG: hypothetical protein AAF399_28205 [Bacteroidota bacterium]